MHVLICGARGSTPAPGAQFVRYGGHTACIAISHKPEEPPSVVIDAGTGIRWLSQSFQGTAFRGTILLSHLHWDHTQGLPFFRAGEQSGARVSLYMPAQGNPVDVLERAMSPPHFPIAPSQFQGDWSFHPLDPGTHDIEGFTVLALEIPHKGGRTYGFRISDGKSSVCYMSDHAPVALGQGPAGFGPYHDIAVKLAANADVLIHDAQYTAAEFPERASFGHSAIDYAVGLANAVNVKQLLLFHHDPARTDDELDSLVASIGKMKATVQAAKEGQTITLGRS